MYSFICRNEYIYIYIYIYISVIQTYVPIFRFISVTDYYKILTIVHYAVQ